MTALALLHSSKDSFGPKIAIPAALVVAIDERIHGLFQVAMREFHGVSIDRAIVHAMRNAYLQGFGDGACRPGAETPIAFP